MSYDTDSDDNLKGEWHHWVFQVNGTTGEYAIYLDGVNETKGTLTTNGFTFDDIDKIRIGSLRGTGQFYDGRMSDVKVYNHELTYSEIRNLYNAQNSPPVAVDDRYTVETGIERHVQAPGVLGNDSDINSNSLSVLL